MKECTFTPVISEPSIPGTRQHKNSVRGPPSTTSSAMPVTRRRKSFERNEEIFMKKKENYIMQKNAELDRQQREMREQAVLVSQNSRKILQQPQTGLTRT